MEAFTQVRPLATEPERLDEKTMLIHGLDRDTGEGILLPTECCPGCGKLMFREENECPLCHWTRPEKERIIPPKPVLIIDKDGSHYE